MTTMTSKPLSSLLLIACLCCVAPRVTQAGEFDVHYKRGMSLYEKKDYEAAAEELLKAYEIRQLPRVLLNLGTLYRKAGKAPEALTFYKRYLRAEPNPPPKIKKELDAFIEQTKALVETPEVQAELEKKKEPAPAGWDRDSGEMMPWLASQLKQEEANRKFYRRPWFWGVIGGVVAAGVIIGVTAGVVANQRRIPGGIDIIQLQLSF